MSKSGESPRPDWGERDKVVLTNIEGEGSYLRCICSVSIQNQNLPRCHHLTEMLLPYALPSISPFQSCLILPADAEPGRALSHAVLTPG